MRWSERLVAGASVSTFVLGGLLALPDVGLLTPVAGMAYATLGQDNLAVDRYAVVEAEPEELSALGRRYLAAITPSNDATFAVYTAMGGGKWPAVQAACKAAITQKRASVNLLAKGEPAWPAELQKDIDDVKADVEKEVTTTQKCVTAKSLEEFTSQVQETPDNGAADRIRVRLGLEPRSWV